jgi:hypothetical protein
MGRERSLLLGRSARAAEKGSERAREGWERGGTLPVGLMADRKGVASGCASADEQDGDGGPRPCLALPWPVAGERPGEVEVEVVPCSSSSSLPSCDVPTPTNLQPLNRRCSASSLCTVEYWSECPVGEM